MFKHHLIVALRHIREDQEQLSDSPNVRLFGEKHVMDNFRPIRFAALAFTAAIAFSTPTYAADAEATLTLESRDLNSLKIFAGEGFLHIQGVDSETIEVVGKIVGGRDSRRFTLKKDGDAAVLLALNTERHFIFAWFGRPRIDVTVRVPSRLILEVRDGPGEVTIAGMKAAAVVIDENDGIYVHDHHGNLNIYDGAGEIKLEDIAGNIYVQDGQGELLIEKVVGDIGINDGIGSIVVKNVDGHVDIHDGNGGVAAANVTRGVTINDGRAGQLAMALVEGKD
jgi:hypothetical protein